MTSFNFIKPDRIYNELFYQYPKVFIEGQTYRNLSEGAKIAYMLLKSRSEFAMLKNQVDEEGHLFFEFTGKELSVLMNCSERRVTSIKKELEEYGLLKQVHMGFNKKTGKNEKNRLYLAELEVSEKDIYAMKERAETLDNSGLAKFATRSDETEADETIDNSGLANFAIRSNIGGTPDNSGLAKFAQEFNNNTLDTNRHLIDTDKDLAQEKVLLDNFSTIMKDNSIATFVPENVLNLIATFSNTYVEAQQTVKTIHNAKYKAQEEAGGLVIVFEELSQYGIDAETSLYATLLKAYQLPKTEKVNNMQNVIFTYVKNWFAEYPLAAKKQFDKRR